MLGLDYDQRISGAALQAAGITHVFRYLGNPANWPKAMTPDEVADLHSNGITIHLNYEQTAEFMSGGFYAGQNFAKEARYWASWLGFRPDTRILYSDDAQSITPATAVDFLNGAASVDGGKANVGAYGKYDVVRAAINAGYVGWQTEAWSYGQFDSRAIAWQMGGQITVAGVSCDKNTMNSTFIDGGFVTQPIPDSIRAKWAAIAGEFQGSYDDSTAIIWADAGARYAAFMADQIYARLGEMQIAATATMPVALTQADYDAIAKATAKEFAALLGVVS